MSDPLGDGVGDGVQEARRRHGLSKNQTSSCEDDDGPQEVVEVLLGQNAGAEEENHGDDSYDSHVAKSGLQLMAHAP